VLEQGLFSKVLDSTPQIIEVIAIRKMKRKIKNQFQLQVHHLVAQILRPKARTRSEIIIRDVRQNINKNLSIIYFDSFTQPLIPKGVACYAPTKRGNWLKLPS